jgi:type IV pilus assembly protein PilA
MKLFRNDEGFTLVELMVVVLIIGILVAVAIPVFNAASASARNRTCQANQRTIEGAVQQWKAADAANTTLPDTTGAFLVPAYIKTLPTCPEGKTAYAMDASGTVTSDKTSGWNAGHSHF